MRRWEWFAAVLGLAVLIGAGLVALWPQPRPTRQTFHRIGRGMSRGKVESILGAPQVELPVKMPGNPSICSGAMWCNPTGQIEVVYDASGTVCETQFSPLGYVPTWTDRLQWLWREWFP
jgi:hypothetical protein